MFFLALSLFLQAAGAAQSVVLRTFDDDKIGAPPAGFVLAAGRDAAADRWTVKRESTDKARAESRVLAHEGNPSPTDSFAVAVLSGVSYQDVSVSVRLKAISGGKTAGVVWKYQDPMNHYFAQLDLTKQEVAIYRVASGNRIRLEREDDLELDPDAWHSLKVFQEDGELRVYLGGIRVFSERDRVVRGPAGVGVWVGGDSTVLFDDFRVEDETEVQKPAAKPQAPRGDAAPGSRD